jgi:surface protein|tara:strand:- start:2321 stop:3703 length:1383 start_codon:yes stop_codon:yes gene_type:complete
MITKLPSYIFIFLILIGCFSRDLEIIEEKLIEYTLTIIESEGGIIDSTGGKYSSGENITLTALPNPGYVFSEWSNGLDTETITIKIESDISIQAFFIPKKNYPPTVSLVGSSTINIEIESLFEDPGAIATDIEDGDISSFINITGDLDTSISGTYILVYEVSDSSGNSSSISRTIIVNEERNSIIYFEDGTCKCPEGSVGFKETINQIEYTVVDNQTIKVEILNNNVNLCTTLVNDMSELFSNNITFNTDISFWDTSNVIQMDKMFFNASTFNKDVGDWDTGKVKNMNAMFKKATLFNNNIGFWDISKVENMIEMFSEADSFNQDISPWNTSSVIYMSYMFYFAINFNQPINSWNTSNLEKATGMFQGAKSFNNELNNWDTSKVNSMTGMFRESIQFNSDISKWDTSNVIAMSYMFKDASVFNQNLSDWCVENIPQEPSDFAEGSILFEVNKPIWGTCPD